MVMGTRRRTAGPERCASLARAVAGAARPPYVPAAAAATRALDAGVGHGLAVPSGPGRGSVHLESGRHQRDRQRARPAPPCPRPRPRRAGSTASTCTRPCRPRRPTTPTSPCSQPSRPPRSSRPPGSPRSAHVWAPMYRQATVAGTTTRSRRLEPAVIATAYDSLLSAWNDYLAHDNHGRPIVFIGHSQGAAMLIRLLQTQVDPSPSLRKQHGVRHHPGRQRAGPRRRGRRWELPQHPDLRVRLADRLRHRLFDLRFDAAGQLALRASRSWGEPAVGSDASRVAAGGVRQPGDVLARVGRVAAVSSSA